jgi:hypothetical protein
MSSVIPAAETDPIENLKIYFQRQALHGFI